MLKLLQILENEIPGQSYWKCYLSFWFW